MQKKLLINGKLVAGQGDDEDVLNPATGKVIAKIGEASAGQVDAAVSAATDAFDGWSRTPPKDRAALLLKLADRIEANGAEFASLESQNVRQTALPRRLMTRSRPSPTCSASSRAQRAR